VFEADFLDCSYGFRPGRNPHHALQALRVQIVTKKVGQVFEADIRSYFTRINHQWLRKMVAHRIADPVILGLIGKWLNAGAMQDGVVVYAKEGTPQGGVASPTLANLVLNGLERELKEHFPKTRHGNNAKVNLCRYADDFVISGKSKELLENEVKPLVERFLKERGLELSQEKTRITHITKGFDFLGQNVRKYKEGLRVKPSKKNVKRFLAR
jgi:RNA-directed DNA polymerase